MPKPFLQRVRRIVGLLADVGVTNKLSVHEKNKVRVLNVSLFLGNPINLFFSIVNFSDGKFFLASINLLLALGGFFIIFLHKKQYFFLARLTMVCGASILFFTISILYRNGSESVLLAFMIISVVLFEDRRSMIATTLSNFILYVTVKVFLLSPIVFDTVPKSRVLFNSIFCLLTVTLSLIYLRKEQERHEQNIQKNLRDLARLNNEKAKLFSIIAHDLRSPIGQLKTLIDLVNAQHISLDTFKSMTNKLALDVDQLQDTMDNLLRWSIGQSHGIHVNAQPISVSAAFDQVIGFYRQNAEKKKVLLFKEESPFTVQADPDHLQLVLRNLVSNAIKYSHADGVIMLRCYAKENKVILQVIDNGAGMAENVLQTIFVPDIFVSQRGTNAEKGTGLGLKLCREFVEKNQGSLWVESLVDKGSTFYVSLPRGA